MLKQIHVYIKGDVIGVGFRAWTKIQGEEDKVNRMLGLLKAGPPVSRVDDVEISWQEQKEIFEGFEIRK